MDSYVRRLRIEAEDHQDDDDDVVGPKAFAGADDEGDPHPFDWLPADGPPLRTDLTITPEMFSAAKAWVYELHVPGKAPVWKLMVLDTDARQWVIVRSAATELELSRFSGLLDCGFHPNALPLRIH